MIPVRSQWGRYNLPRSIAFHHLRSISRCFQWWNKKKRHLIPCPTRCPNSFFAKPMPAVMNSLSRDSSSKNAQEMSQNQRWLNMIWWDFQRGFNGCEWDFYVFNGIYHDANGIFMGVTMMLMGLNEIQTFSSNKNYELMGFTLGKHTKRCGKAIVS